MALTPDPNQSFYREVDEELRRSQVGNFWSRYGKALVIGLVLLAVAVGAYFFWKNREAKEAERQGELLDAAITDLGGGKEKAAAPKLARLAGSKNPGYRGTALLAQADAALSANNPTAAIALFRRIAGDPALPQPFRDLALVRQTATEFDTIAPALVIERLRPLARPGNPWFGSAGEMTGVAYLKQGKPAQAAPLFAAIARDEGVPETIRSRVVQMAGTLGIDAIEDKSTGAVPPSATPAPAAQRN